MRNEHSCEPHGECVRDHFDGPSRPRFSIAEIDREDDMIAKMMHLHTLPLGADMPTVVKARIHESSLDRYENELARQRAYGV